MSPELSELLIAGFALMLGGGAGAVVKGRFGKSSNGNGNSLKHLLTHEEHQTICRAANAELKLYIQQEFSELRESIHRMLRGARE